METKTEEVANVQPKANLRDIGQLFRDSWDIFAAGWKKFLIFSLIAGGIGLGIFLVYVIAAVVLGIALFDFSTGNINWPALIMIVVLGLVTLAIVGTTLALAANKLVYNIGEKNNEFVKAALGYGWKNFLPFLLVEFLLILILVPSYILLVIPGLILTIFFSMITPVFVLEGKRGLDAFKRSWNLVRGDFWAVLGRLALLFLISIVISSVQNSVSEPSISFLLSLILIVPQFILSFFSVAYSYLIYKDLSAAKKA